MNAVGIDVSKGKNTVAIFRPGDESEILNAIRFSWSNGFTEGCNNKIKVLKRVCFGVKNFNRFRNRILHCST